MILKTKANTNVKKLASSITLALENDNKVEIRCIGASSVNQAIKATIIARSMTIVKGYDLHIVPCFEDVAVEGKEEDHRTLVNIVVKKVY